MACHYIIKDGKKELVHCTKRFYKPNRREIEKWNKSWEKKEDK